MSERTSTTLRKAVWKEEVFQAALQEEGPFLASGSSATNPRPGALSGLDTSASVASYSTPGSSSSGDILQHLQAAASSGENPQVPEERWRQHEQGRCMPCRFHMRGHCSQGERCSLCHEPHDRRPRAGTRTRRYKADQAAAKTAVAAAETAAAAEAWTGCAAAPMVGQAPAPAPACRWADLPTEEEEEEMEEIPSS